METHSLSEMIRQISIAGSLVEGRPVITTGAGVPTAPGVAGQIYVRTGSGTLGSERLYFWDDASNTWKAVTGVTDVSSFDRDDTPVACVNCNSGPNPCHPEYATGLGGGYSVHYPALRDKILNAPWTRVMMVQPKGECGGDASEGGPCTPGNTNLGSKGTFNASQYGVDGIIDPTIGQPYSGLPYINDMFRDVFAETRLTRPTLKFCRHSGLWCEAPTQMWSSRLMNPATDLAWYVQSDLDYQNIGFDGESFIDASTQPLYFPVMEAIAAASPARVSLEGIPWFQDGPLKKLDLPKVLKYASWMNAFDILNPLWASGFDQIIAPGPPYQECIVILFADSALSDAETVIRMRSLFQRGFVLGALVNEANVTQLKTDIVLEAMA